MPGGIIVPTPRVASQSRRGNQDDAQRQAMQGSANGPAPGNAKQRETRHGAIAFAH